MIFRLALLFGFLSTFTFETGASLIRERAADSSLLPSTRDSPYDTPYFNSSSTTEILQGMSTTNPVIFHDEPLKLHTADLQEASPERTLPAIIETSATSTVTGLTTSTTSIPPLSQVDQNSRVDQVATSASPASRDNHGRSPSPEVTSTSYSSPGDQGTGPSQGTSSNSSASQNDHGGDGLKKEAIIGVAIGIPSALVAIGTIIGFLRKRMEGPT